VPKTLPPPEQLLALLRESPARIAELTVGLTPEQLRATPDFGGWSVNEVLAHLRACADVWGGCVATIVVEDEPTIRAVNPRTWIRETDYVERAFRPSFKAFRKQRDELLAVLEPLPAGDWSRQATVTGAGAPLVRTVWSYVESIAVHERSHVKQIRGIAEAVRG
jgi:hypothetical protein